MAKRIPNTTIKLAGKPLELVYSNTAVFKLQSLPNGAPALTQTRAFFAACCWVWAMLPPELEGTYGSPADVAPALDLKELGDTILAIGDAIEKSKAPKGTAKNA